MIVKLLTEHHLELLSSKKGCRGLSESTHVKMAHCWKSHALAQFYYIVRGDQDSRANLMPIYGDLYQIKL